MNQLTLTGKITSPIKFKYKNSEDKAQNKINCAYFDFAIDDDKTKITVLVSDITNIVKVKLLKPNSELFLEGSLDFQSEIKSQRLPFEHTDIMLQLKVYHPVINARNIKILSQGGPSTQDIKDNIITLADEV